MEKDKEMDRETEAERCRVTAGGGGRGEVDGRGGAGALGSTGNQPLPGALGACFPISAGVLGAPPSPNHLSPLRRRKLRLREGKGEACSKLGTKARSQALPLPAAHPIPPAPLAPTAISGHSLLHVRQGPRQPRPHPPAGEHHSGLSCPQIVIIQDQAWVPRRSACPSLGIRDFLEEVTSDLALGGGGQ